MTAPQPVRRRLPGRSPALLFAVAAAVLAGVLVTAVAVPERTEVVRAYLGTDERAINRSRQGDASPRRRDPLVASPTGGGR